MAGQAQTAGETAITSDGYPVLIPAEDGGYWILVQGSTCEVTSVPSTTALPVTPSLFQKILGYVPEIEAAIGGTLMLVGAL